MARLRERLRAWFIGRLPLADSHTLTQRNLYILPTRGGWGFCATLIVLLLASINYQLNLGYALTFLLGGAALVSMHQTHGNLKRLTLRLRAPAPVFVGEPATLEVVLSNPARRDRPAVGLALHSAWREGMAFVDVPAQGSNVARLRYTPDARGRRPLPTLVVETHFPLGLFRAWSIWRPATPLLVYPRPEQPPQPLPPGTPVGGQAPTERRGAGSEFDGVRAWRRGDTLRQVVWKKVARSGELVSRDMGASATQALALSWPAAAGPGAGDSEARLSRLTAWVLAAERQGLPYTLELPGRRLASDLGDTQRRTALEALACWGLAEQASPAAQAAPDAPAAPAAPPGPPGPTDRGLAA
jgi:uncharacterized protein (DUF58 family)